MRIAAVLLALAQLWSLGWAHAAERTLQVLVAAPYIELHAGPGEDFPVFYAARRSESVWVIERKTDWFKVRTTKGKEGWVHRSEMEQTVLTSGERFEVKELTIEEYEQRRWEVGGLGGSFDGATTIGLYGAYHFTQNLSSELSVSQIFADYSNSWFANVAIVHQAFPHWRVSPFVLLGGGYIHTEPKATLTRPPNLDDYSAHVGIGARMYLTRRFLLRAEYRNYVVFTDDDDTNQEVDEWKAGIGFFF